MGLTELADTAVLRLQRNHSSSPPSPVITTALQGNHLSSPPALMDGCTRVL